MKLLMLFITMFALPAAIHSAEEQSYTIEIGDQEKNLTIRKGSIVEEFHCAIVNAANPQLNDGGGVCGVIFRAAGKECLTLQCHKYVPDSHGVRCPVGEARITFGCALEQRGIFHIIHAVGPDARIIHDVTEQKRLLEKAYKSSLDLAQSHQITKIAFPFISSGIYAVDPHVAAHSAALAVLDWLKDNQLSNVETVVFVLNSDEHYHLFIKTVEALLGL
jgi:O-acetyl-ADP-ribose deacetylase